MTSWVACLHICFHPHFWLACWKVNWRWVSGRVSLTAVVVFFRGYLGRVVILFDCLAAREYNTNIIGYIIGYIICLPVNWRWVSRRVSLTAVVVFFGGYLGRVVVLFDCLAAREYNINIIGYIICLPANWITISRLTVGRDSFFLAAWGENLKFVENFTTVWPPRLRLNGRFEVHILFPHAEPSS